MKICLLTHTFPKNKNDSTAAFLHALVTGIEESGVDVTVLTPYHRNINEKDFPYQVVVYRYIWPKFLQTLGYGETLKQGIELPLRAYIIAPFLFIFGSLKLSQVCRRKKITIISSHWILPNGIMAALVSKLTGVPYLVNLPGSDVYLAQKNYIFKKIAIFAANNAEVVIADSPIFAEKIVQLGAKPKKVEIMPYPVNTEIYKPNPKGVRRLREKYNFHSSDVVLLAVGRLVEKKGFKFLILALENAIEKNKNIRLVIVGSGDLEHQLKALVKKIKMDRYITFAGNINRDEILTYYNMADIFVMPSIVDRKGNTDDQPVALLEAMACGLPVVATNFPGISLSVEDKVNGFLVPQKNVSKIAQAIGNLCSSEKLREQMGKESWKIAKSKFSIEKIGERYRVIFNSISK